MFALSKIQQNKFAIGQLLLFINVYYFVLLIYSLIYKNTFDKYIYSFSSVDDEFTSSSFHLTIIIKVSTMPFSPTTKNKNAFGWNATVLLYKNPKIGAVAKGIKVSKIPTTEKTLPTSFA